MHQAWVHLKTSFLHYCIKKCFLHLSLLVCSGSVSNMSGSFSWWQKKIRDRKTVKNKDLIFTQEKFGSYCIIEGKKKKKRCELFELDYTLGISPQLYGSFNPSNTLEWQASNFSLQYHPLITHQGHENKENDHRLEALDYETNSPHQHLRECIGNSIENIHTDVRVERVKVMRIKEMVTNWTSSSHKNYQV